MDQQNVGSKRPAASGTGKIAAKSHEAAEQLKDAVVGQVNQTRERALSAQGNTSERIRGVASHLNDLSDTLRDQDPMIANLARRASQGVEGLARYVGEASPQSIIADTERVARRQPALFYGAAFLVGLAAARFIKSSRPGGSSEAEYDRNDGGAVDQQRLERQSGFFPADRNARSNQRFQENYDAAFGRDDTPGQAGSPNRVTPPPAERATTGVTSGVTSESRDNNALGSNDALGNRARKGNFS
jgi:hypothetical protein